MAAKELAKQIGCKILNGFGFGLGMGTAFVLTGARQNTNSHKDNPGQSHTNHTCKWNHEGASSQTTAEVAEKETATFEESKTFT